MKSRASASFHINVQIMNLVCLSIKHGHNPNILNVSSRIHFLAFFFNNLSSKTHNSRSLTSKWFLSTPFYSLNLH